MYVSPRVICFSLAVFPFHSFCMVNDVRHPLVGLACAGSERMFLSKADYFEPCMLMMPTAHGHLCVLEFLAMRRSPQMTSTKMTFDGHHLFVRCIMSSIE